MDNPTEDLQAKILNILATKQKQEQEATKPIEPPIVDTEEKFDPSELLRDLLNELLRHVPVSIDYFTTCITGVEEGDVSIKAPENLDIYNPIEQTKIICLLNFYANILNMSMQAMNKQFTIDMHNQAKVKMNIATDIMLKDKRSSPESIIMFIDGELMEAVETTPVPDEISQSDKQFFYLIVGTL